MEIFSCEPDFFQCILNFKKIGTHKMFSFSITHLWSPNNILYVFLSEYYSFFLKYLICPVNLEPVKTVKMQTYTNEYYIEQKLLQAGFGIEYDIDYHKLEDDINNSKSAKKMKFFLGEEKEIYFFLKMI